MGVVWINVDLWEQSSSCFGSIPAPLALVASELCRRVRPLHISSSIFHLSFIIILSTPPAELMDARTART